MSQRRVAILLGVHRNTVARKLQFLGLSCRFDNDCMRMLHMPVSKMQFDDLETFEHSKCKPLSVIMAIEEHSRRIMGFRVSVMPAKGHLASVSRKKYGRRPDNRRTAREELFKEIQPFVLPSAMISSDESPHYLVSVRKWFPKSTHVTHKGRKACVAGQGELKKGGFDPLFGINHTFAMLRANINRLIRRSWCTTKNIDRLRDHIELYVYFHNTVLLKKA